MTKKELKKVMQREIKELSAYITERESNKDVGKVTYADVVNWDIESDDFHTGFDAGLINAYKNVARWLNIK